jgi:hypothetical protein
MNHDELFIINYYTEEGNLVLNFLLRRERETVSLNCWFVGWRCEQNYYVTIEKLKIKLKKNIFKIFKNVKNSHVIITYDQIAKKL